MRKAIYMHKIYLPGNKLLLIMNCFENTLCIGFLVYDHECDP